jgi:hypothetical protein
MVLSIRTLVEDWPKVSRLAELEHVALLAVTTLGWPQAIKGLTWIRDVTQALSDESQAPKSANR